MRYGEMPAHRSSRQNAPPGEMPRAPFLPAFTRAESRAKRPAVEFFLLSTAL